MTTDAWIYLMVGSFSIAVMVVVVGLAQQAVQRRRAEGLPLLPDEGEMQRVQARWPLGLGTPLIQGLVIAALGVAQVATHQGSTWFLVLAAAVALSTLWQQWKRWRAR